MSYKTPAIRNGINVPFIQGLKRQPNQQPRQTEARYQHMPKGPFNQFQRVIAPVLNGQYLAIAQALCVSHADHTVSILEVVTPIDMALGGAQGVEISLRGGLAHGDYYHMISVFKLPTQIAFQVFANHDTRKREPEGVDGLRAFFDTPVSQVMHHFPDIRRASAQSLDKLEAFTGLKFGINLQLRAKAYQEAHAAADATRYELRNTGAKALNAFNAGDMFRMQQDMEQFADVAYGTSLAEARRKMKMVQAVDDLATADAVCNLLGAAGVVEVETVLPASRFEITEDEAVPTVVTCAPVAFEADPVAATELAAEYTDESVLEESGVVTLNR
jgi:hypothetical protein